MIDSEKIMAVVISMIVIGIGAFAVLVTWGELQEDLPADEDYTTTTYYNETYQPPDKNATNATEDWYVYSESGLPWMNVTNMTSGPLPDNSNQTFRMNTTADTPATGGVLYDFVNESSYDSFSLYTMVNASAHNYTQVTIGSWIDAFGISGNGAIAFWNITNTSISFHVLSLDGPVYTQVWSQSIATGNWYHLDATFDYDTNNICSTIYSVGVAGAETLQQDGCQESGVPFTNLTQSFWAITEVYGDANCSILFDDFKLTDDSTIGVDSLNDNIPNVYGLSNAVFQIIGLVVMIASIMGIVAILYKYGKIGK